MNDRKESPSWYALYTHPKQEARAHSNLLSWGVESFYPRLRERRLNQFSGASTYFAKPMFPRYVFAKFDAAAMLHKVWYTRGVSSVVSFGDGGPVPIPDEIMEMLHGRVGADGYVRLYDELKSGDNLVITAGPLKSFRGVFERHVKDGERVMLLLDTVNSQSRLSVERDLVKKVA
jgi:transcription elongation factor/antiterminator RfaH